MTSRLPNPHARYTTSVTRLLNTDAQKRAQVPLGASRAPASPVVATESSSRYMAGESHKNWEAIPHKEFSFTSINAAIQFFGLLFGVFLFVVIHFFRHVTTIYVSAFTDWLFGFGSTFF